MTTADLKAKGNRADRTSDTERRRGGIECSKKERCRVRAECRQPVSGNRKGERRKSAEENREPVRSGTIAAAAFAHNGRTGMD